jgi:hypothetical protein
VTTESPLVRRVRELIPDEVIEAAFVVTQRRHQWLTIIAPVVAIVVVTSAMPGSGILVTTVVAALAAGFMMMVMITLFSKAFVVVATREEIVLLAANPLRPDRPARLDSRHPRTALRLAPGRQGTSRQQVDIAGTPYVAVGAAADVVRRIVEMD